MSTFEKFTCLECITLLADRQMQEIKGGGDPPPWYDDDDDWEDE